MPTIERPPLEAKDQFPTEWTVPQTPGPERSGSVGRSDRQPQTPRGNTVFKAPENIAAHLKGASYHPAERRPPGRV